MKGREATRRWYWLLRSQLGLDPLRLWRSMWVLRQYFRDLRSFKKNYSGSIRLLPCLHDRNQEAGITKSEYFWQDLAVARMISDINPERHIDVGSRIDGFVAHVASFRSIDVVDIRPITTNVPGVRFIQADLSQPLQIEARYDSVSCLHALEHFGLGRYGDQVDPQGYVQGLKNLAMLMAPAGRLYLSVPIGIPRVEFNAHRVFDPLEIITLARQFDLMLESFLVVESGCINSHAIDSPTLRTISRRPYSLGIFIFRN